METKEGFTVVHQSHEMMTERGSVEKVTETNTILEQCWYVLDHWIARNQHRSQGKPTMMWIPCHPAWNALVACGDEVAFRTWGRNWIAARRLEASFASDRCAEIRKVIGDDNQVGDDVHG